MKLIIEECPEHRFITEAKEGEDKKLYIEGIFLQAEKKNKNGRVYPEEILTNEVARYTKEHIENKTAYGELDHPISPSVNLKNVGIHIKSLKKEGTDFIGKALVASTPMGNIIRGLINDGANLGVSSRGLGTMKPGKDAIIIQDDYRLITAADCVAHPSGIQCFVDGIMEGTEWIWDEKFGYRAITVVEQTKAEIKKMPIKQITEEYKLKAFKKFLDNIV